MSLEPSHSPQPEPDDDLPRLPPLPIEVIHERLRDSLGGSINTYRVLNRFTDEALHEALILSSGRALSLDELKDILCGKKIPSLELVADLALAMDSDVQNIYRNALLLEQFRGMSKIEQLEHILWLLKRRIKEYGEDAN